MENQVANNVLLCRLLRPSSISVNRAFMHEAHWWRSETLLSGPSSGT